MTLFFFHVFLITKSQNLRISKRKSLDQLLDNNTDNRTITSIMLDSLLKDHMYQISGTNIKEGKSAASAATIDDKGATVNLSFKPFHKMIFLQPTIAASSSKGFSDVFSSGQYNRVLTGGISVQKFLYSKIKFPDDTYLAQKTKLHNMLRVQRKKYLNMIKTHQNPWQTDIDSATQLYKKNAALLSQIGGGNPPLTENDIQNGGAEIIIQYYSHIRKLIGRKLLAPVDINLAPSALDAKLQAINATTIDNLLLDEMLSITDSLQYHVQATKVIKWFSFGVNYNTQAQPILDTTRKGLVRTYNNEYVSGKVAYNRLSLRDDGSGYYISPNVSFSNNRNFKEGDKKTLNLTTPVIIGNSAGDKIDASVTYYEKVAERKFTWVVELPLLLYWKKSNLGLDVAVHAGANDPKGDNIGGRIGVYIPVGTKGESTLMIEPLLRIQKLFENGTDKFFKDNLAFGFNVSVSLPAFFSKK